MTSYAPPSALDVYLQHPLDDGNAVLLLDGVTCLELDRPAGPDDADLARLARGLRGSCTEVSLAVARPGRRPRPDDLLLWTGLCAALEGSGVTLLPLVLLPAA